LLEVGSLRWEKACFTTRKTACLARNQLAAHFNRTPIAARFVRTWFALLHPHCTRFTSLLEIVRWPSAHFARHPIASLAFSSFQLVSLSQALASAANTTRKVGWAWPGAPLGLECVQIGNLVLKKVRVASSTPLEVRRKKKIVGLLLLPSKLGYTL
jgi:hypothetical protein